MLLYLHRESKTCILTKKQSKMVNNTSNIPESILIPFASL